MEARRATAFLNDEIRNPNDESSPNDGMIKKIRFGHSSIQTLIRHSAFEFRHLTKPLVSILLNAYGRSAVFVIREPYLVRPIVNPWG